VSEQWVTVWRVCPECSGEGVVDMWWDGEDGFAQCQDCNGDGGWIEDVF